MKTNAISAARQLLLFWVATCFFTPWWLPASLAACAASAPLHPAAPNTIDFEVVRGMIIVQAEIEGEKAGFILDTGSPAIILNEKNHETVTDHAASFQGLQEGKWKRVGQFSLAGIRKYGLEALAMNISHLERITERKIRGLIGYDFLKDFDWVIDFEKRKITLLSGGVKNPWKHISPDAEVPFLLEGHLPVVEARIGHTVLRLGLDTGAGINLIDAGRKEDIAVEQLVPTPKTPLVGLDSRISDAFTAEIRQTTVGGITYPDMRYVFSDISHLANLSGNDVDGLLGYPFFRSGVFIIGYRRNIITFYSRVTAP